MDKTNTILDEFRQNSELYNNLKDDIEDILNRIIASNKIKISNLAIRIKQEKSLTKKIMYKNKYQHIEDVTDVVACRIITLFEDDVERLKDLIMRNFEVVELSDRRKKENKVREEYGYNSLHLIVKFTKERCELVEYEPYKNIAFEIQLRTALQHSWCEIEHGLGYKSKYEIPKHIRRRLNRLSATLELLDEEFVSIAKDIEEYNQGLEHEEKILKTDINILSLQKYSLHNSYFKTLMENLSKEYQLEMEYDISLISQFRVVQRLNYMGFGYIHELDELLKTHHQQIDFVSRTWTEVTSRNKNTINYYVCLIWLTVCGLVENGDNTVNEIVNKELLDKIKQSSVLNFAEELTH
ncbi:MAG: GTP pyrophosphokinase family protein [Beduini sp.]